MTCLKLKIIFICRNCWYTNTTETLTLGSEDNVVCEYCHTEFLAKEVMSFVSPKHPNQK